MIICKQTIVGQCEMVLDVSNWEYSHTLNDNDGKIIIVIKEVEPMKMEVLNA